MLLLVILGIVLAPTLRGQTTPEPYITASATGRVSAEADLAIVFLVIRSTAPLASDALAQNMRKAREIEARVTALGLKERTKFSGNRFAPATGPYYGGPRPAASAFEISEYVYVFFEGAELKDKRQFEKRVGEVVDEMTRLGAVAGDSPITRISSQVPYAVAFTVKDPSPHLAEVLRQATEKVRASAAEIARGLRVQITGIAGVNTNVSTFYNPPGANALDDLPYEFVSSWNEVPISISLSVQYRFR